MVDVKNLVQSSTEQQGSIIDSLNRFHQLSSNGECMRDALSLVDPPPAPDPPAVISDESTPIIPNPTAVTAGSGEEVSTRPKNNNAFSGVLVICMLILAAACKLFFTFSFGSE